MKQIKSILINTICIVSLFGLMSCIKEIDLESLRPDPTLVVNCVAITGEPLTVSVLKFIAAARGVLKRDPDVAFKGDLLGAVLFVLVCADVAVKHKASNENLATLEGQKVCNMAVHWCNGRPL